MPHYFPHENLEVYAQAVSFAKFAAALIDSWPPVFAICDQLDRATESVVTNLVTAAAIESDTAKGVLARGVGHAGRVESVFAKGRMKEMQGEIR